MLTRNELELIWNIECSSRRCIRGFLYYEAINEPTKNRWKFTRNCIVETSIILWCQVFGSRNEPTHFSKIFNSADTCLPFSLKDVQTRLQQAANMTEDEYSEFWNTIKRTRDKFFVHNEFDVEVCPIFPDTIHMKNVCLEMRKILKEIVDNCESNDSEYQHQIEHFLNHYTNETFINEIQTDLPYIESASKEY